tara:strand:- start:56 stop:913 length:858 start_codon:yes stop_codon:yes gene_type:complete
MAINFPSTSGQATDGSFTHTASGITWAWDGTTWKAEGVTSSYTLPTAAANTKGGVKIGSGLTMTGETLSADASAITVQEEGNDLSTAATTLNFVGSNVTASGTGAVKTITISDSDTQLTTEQVQDIVGAMFSGNTETNITATYQDSDGTIDLVATASSGLQSRATGQATSTGLANNAAGNLTIVAAKTYALHKIQTSHAAWVTLYTDTTARTNDAARTETTDPLPGSGIIAEVITSDGATQPITPGTIGWNNEGTPTTNAYVKVVNKSGSTADVTVTLHFVALEA